MRLLLDTHAVIWWLSGDKRLSPAARSAIAHNATRSFVSVASIWEASIKRTAGRLDGPDLLPAVTAAGFPFLAIDERHANLAGQLPPHHRDPFDRMLVAQAATEDLTLVTRDERLAAYGVSVLW